FGDGQRFLTFNAGVERVYTIDGVLELLYATSQAGAVGFGNYIYSFRSLRTVDGSPAPKLDFSRVATSALTSDGVVLGSVDGVRALTFPGGVPTLGSAIPSGITTMAPTAVAGDGQGHYSLGFFYGMVIGLGSGRNVLNRGKPLSIRGTDVT